MNRRMDGVGVRGAKAPARGQRRSRAKAAGADAPTPTWYKDAIIYELHVRSFQDSNTDGIGDFPGLTSRLDYLQDLGVTAIWLLPFYPSPLRDDGYDIADYTAINPAYGTMRDFARFVEQAHAHGLRVITELVINHTSDQHPWFQRARRSPRGSTLHGFYVWSDTPDRFAEARIIFRDTETSNWAWDPVAGQYYWHRFFSHQPDLNYDNPAVREAVLRVMDFWFDKGVDGMRLDAVPYLFEREGTNCENLPETHEVLRELRRHVDAKWPGRMLLAEANQWPEDAIAYFGEGDECHMNFHFPLMPRLFMGVRLEDRFPIVDILDQTPPIPEPCQWAMFLRNHDELTLEMVTDEERDYMYRTYALDRQMRINLGIRRRLAPLLDNNRRKIELLNGLLMSLPGTPVLYYGDEIGMGDNVYLGDRDAVRTPMQWSGDRNAGFSRANPQMLYLPLIIDPNCHYEVVNVESQQQNISSLFWWMKRLLGLRKRHPVMGQGKMEFLHPENPKVLTYLRFDDSEHFLVVANLSRFSQPLELDLSRFEGWTPVEAFGNTRFPPIGKLPYFLTLGPHAFHWFRLEAPRVAEALGEEEMPTVEIDGDPSRWLRGAGLRRWIGSRMPRDLPRHRWFAGKAKTIREVAVDETVGLGSFAEGVADAVLLIARVTYTQDDDEIYAIPLALLEPDRALRQMGAHGAALLANVRQRGDGARWTLCDAVGDDDLWKALRTVIQRRRRVRGQRGDIVGVPVAGRGRPKRGETLPPDEPLRVLKVEQSNSSAIFGQRSIMKLFRRVEAGINPEYEIGLHLSAAGEPGRPRPRSATPQRNRFANAPALEGAIEYRAGRGEPMLLAMLQEFVPNEGDAWAFTLDAVGRFFDKVMEMTDHIAPGLPGEDVPDADHSTRPHDSPRQAGGYVQSTLEHAARPPEDREIELLGDYIHAVHLLGQRSAEMHSALADSEHEDFKPEPFTKLYRRSLYQSLRNRVERPLQALQSGVRRLEGTSRELTESLLARRSELQSRLALVRETPIDGVRIRCHGDFHLGQVLWTGRDFSIIDFEGEPMRPLSERRLKRSCLSDVAGMSRSLHYAARAGLRDLVQRGVIGPMTTEQSALDRWAAFWIFSAESAFLRGYLQHIDKALIPSEPAGVQILLDVWRLAKAAYEVGYELNNRPDWIEIPLRGMIDLLDVGERR